CRPDRNVVAVAGLRLTQWPRGDECIHCEPDLGSAPDKPEKYFSSRARRTGMSAGVDAKMIPLSNAQRRLWFIDRFAGRSAVYNVPLVVRLRGALDVAALPGALRDVVGRHEILRTMIVENAGTPAQLVVPVDELRLELPVLDVTGDELAAATADAACYRFDL